MSEPTTMTGMEMRRLSLTLRIPPQRRRQLRALRRGKEGEVEGRGNAPRANRIPYRTRFAAPVLTPPAESTRRTVPEGLVEDGARSGVSGCTAGDGATGVLRSSGSERVEISGGARRGGRGRRETYGGSRASRCQVERRPGVLTLQVARRADSARARQSGSAAFACW